MSLPLFKVMLFFPDLSQQLGLWLKRSSWAYPIDLFWTWKPAVSSTLNVSAADLPSQLAVAVTPDYSWLRSSRYTPFSAEVTNMQPFNPNDCLSWNDPLGREVMICLYCAIEWNSLLSSGLNHRGQSHLGCILRSLIFWFIAVLYLSLPDSPSSRLSQTSLVFFGSQELSRDCSFLKPLASTPGNKTLPIGETIFFPLFFSLATCSI